MVKQFTLCEGDPPVTAGFPSQSLVKRCFDVFFDLRLNKLLNQQSRRWLFKTPSHLLWRHCNFVWALKTAWNPWKVLELLNLHPWNFLSFQISEISLSECKSFNCFVIFFWSCFNLGKTGHWLIGLKVHCQFATWLHPVLMGSWSLE